MATEHITVVLDGDTHLIYKDEILRSDDKIFTDSYNLRERTAEDIREAEMHLHQLRHALSSINNTLRDASVRYIASKANNTPGEKSNNDD